MGKRAVCIISGGMDSTLCAYLAKKGGYDIVALHFDYGQRTQEKERECFYAICENLCVEKHICINADFIKYIGGNALTDSKIEIPKHSLHKHDTPITYVPFRNGIFLSIAAALAEVEHCEAIFMGIIQNDNSGYPDCSQEFINKTRDFINQGIAINIKIDIKTPLLHLHKSDVVSLAMQESVPLELTWSCYESNEIACGACDSCLLRLEGFKKAGYEDRIRYAISK